MNGYLPAEEVAVLAKSMPHGIVRFTERGQLADWRDDILGWMVTGSERAWGNPIELVKTFGPYEVIVAVPGGKS